MLFPTWGIHCYRKLRRRKYKWAQKEKKGQDRKTDGEDRPSSLAAAVSSGNPPEGCEVGLDRGSTSTCIRNLSPGFGAQATRLRQPTIHGKCCPSASPWSKHLWKCSEGPCAYGELAKRVRQPHPESLQLGNTRQRVWHQGRMSRVACVPSQRWQQGQFSLRAPWVWLCCCLPSPGAVNGWWAVGTSCRRSSSNWASMRASGWEEEGPLWALEVQSTPAGHHMGRLFSPMFWTADIIGKITNLGIKKKKPIIKNTRAKRLWKTLKFLHFFFERERKITPEPLWRLEWWSYRRLFSLGCCSFSSSAYSFCFSSYQNLKSMWWNAAVICL